MKIIAYLLLQSLLAAVYNLNDSQESSGRIKHLVILVLENRSFDSFLGNLKRDRPEVNGVDRSSYEIMQKVENVKIDYISREEIDDIVAGNETVGLRSRFKVKDKYNPGHFIPDITEQLYGNYNGTVNGQQATMNGFMKNIKRVLKSKTNAKRSEREKRKDFEGAVDSVFGLHSGVTLPVHYHLANEYSISDEYFSSVPGPTWPNRHFIHCATAKGQTDNRLSLFGPLNVFRGLDCKTTFRNMKEGNQSFQIYYDGKVPQVALYKDLHLRQLSPFKKFEKDAKEGKLKSYTFIDPDYIKNDFHPPHNLKNGEKFLKRVYNAVRSSPQWNSTLLVVTYDEHGGFYDHVPPPVNVPVPDSGKIDRMYGDFKFDRLGVRVLTLFISPLVPKGGVFRSGVKNRYMEHSSISATLKKLFDLKNYLTRRDSWALSFHNVDKFVEGVRDCDGVLD